MKIFEMNSNVISFDTSTNRRVRYDALIKEFQLIRMYPFLDISGISKKFSGQYIFGVPDEFVALLMLKYSEFIVKEISEEDIQKYGIRKL